ncbi:MAG TPA: exo-beta-N-acetylmuramidase NamZ domain-containing protein, partial [Methylomirabilota bacterium]|nr:exo-beta-N-acetylmuramidase NamZ domain-containing protein [Methylomirabilota bacterium]
AMEAAITNAIAEGRLPGAVFWVESRGQSYQKAVGRRAVVPAPEAMTLDTIFDAASLTKVVATAPAILILAERGLVNLDEPVATYLPEFAGAGTNAITVRHLLTHTSGLRAGLSRALPWTGYATAIRLACEEKATAPPGTQFLYSDINYILLGEIVARTSERPLDDFTATDLFAPLGMTNTGFLPPETLHPRIAPTENSEEGMLRGRVHDPTARRMGGVAGHAGLFTTAADLARFARMMLNGGELDGVRVLRPGTVKLMTSVQSPKDVPTRRGLGWDIDSAYSRPRGQWFPLGSFGHTGWTGTCLWIDPFSQTFWIFLSNRVHPDGKGNTVALYSTLGTLAAEAIEGFDFRNVPGSLAPRATPATNTTPVAPVIITNRADAASARPPVEPPRAPATNVTAAVLTGLDVLVKQNFAPLKRLRLGLITNHTGQDRRRNSTIDLLFNAPEVELKALFSPEHGIRGEVDHQVGDGQDARTGLPVYSLYPPMPKRRADQSEADYETMALKLRAPRPEQLAGLDALVFDIQDIGCRFYTYISTLGNCLEAAAAAGLRFFVLDRPNPINGVAIEGPVHAGHSTFVAYHALPLRHGMTVGELARMFAAERGYQAQLTVIPLEDWRRDLWFDQTGLGWVNPSPNMRSMNAATLYPGLGLLESALSVGRGTDRPFEVLGAPYIDDRELASALNRAGLPGVSFVPIRFTPLSSTFSNQPCGGVAIVVTDRERCRPVELGIEVARTLFQLYPRDFALARMRHLLRDEATLNAIKAGEERAAIVARWERDLAAFRKRREAFLLYR